MAGELEYFNKDTGGIMEGPSNWVNWGTRIKVGTSGTNSTGSGCGRHSGGGYVGEGMGAGGACLDDGSNPPGGDSYTSRIGSPTAPGGGSGPGGGGPGGGGSGLGGVAEGMKRASGADFSGLMGPGYNGDTGPAVGMGPAGGDPLDINTPQAPGMEIGPDRAGAGNTQNLSGPQPMRQGLGSRIYPALNALLKHPAY